MRDKPSPELMRALETLGKRPVQPPATPQEPDQMPSMQIVASLSPEQIREEWRILRDRRWDWHDQNLVVRPFVDELIGRASTPSPEGQTTWQPIETAPKDSAVLLWLGWRLEIGHFNTGLGRWAANWDHRALEVPATHWMPLPSPPTPEGTQP